MPKPRKEEEYDPIEVDAYHLDKEWQAQPRLMRQASIALANARKEERAAKAALELMEAEMKLAVRRVPERYGFSKAPSNEVVEAVVITLPEYQRALREYSMAKHDADVLEADVTALHQKKAALENSVILFCRDYGAECKLPKEHSASARDRMERTTTGDRWAGTVRQLEDD